MRIDFVYVTVFGGKVPVNPDALDCILSNNSSTGCGAAELVLRSGLRIQTSMSVEAATKLFSPMPIAGGR